MASLISDCLGERAGRARARQHLPHEIWQIKNPLAPQKPTKCPTTSSRTNIAPHTLANSLEAAKATRHPWWTAVSSISDGPALLPTPGQEVGENCGAENLTVSLFGSAEAKQRVRTATWRLPPGWSMLSYQAAHSLQMSKCFVKVLDVALPSEARAYWRLSVGFWRSCSPAQKSNRFVLMSSTPKTLPNKAKQSCAAISPIHCQTLHKFATDVYGLRNHIAKSSQPARPTMLAEFGGSLRYDLQFLPHCVLERAEIACHPIVVHEHGHRSLAHICPYRSNCAELLDAGRQLGESFDPTGRQQDPFRACRTNVIFNARLTEQQLI